MHVELSEFFLLLVNKALNGAGDTPDALNSIALVNEGEMLGPNYLLLFLVHLDLLLKKPLYRLNVVFTVTTFKLLLNLRARIRTHQVSCINITIVVVILRGKATIVASRSDPTRLPIVVLRSGTQERRLIVGVRKVQPLIF